ncbi:hypothetical protein JCM11491_003810 [Sporobolomyces phaffii]
MFLPPELWDHVLSFLPADDLQRTALALTRAIPSADPSTSVLWRHLRLSREGQAWQAIDKLRLLDSGVKRAVKSVQATAFREDPQQLVNLLLSLPATESLELHVGPLFAPEQLDELLLPASALASRRFARLESLAFRFNPYCMERSYFVFLKGTYFDSVVHNLARFSPETAPRVRRLEFTQDLSPNHGSRQKKDTPAFGLHELRSELDGIESDLGSIDASQQPPASGRFARKPLEDNGKLDFAQPIVFFRLDCLAPLSVSPVGQNLTSLTLRLPRRNLLPALSLETSPSNPPFRSLVHLDLSTTHLVDDARLATFLRLVPRLESLVLDRCTGLVSPDAVDEPTAVQTVRWLGKVCGGVGLHRADDAAKSWKRIVKERPTDAPNLLARSSTRTRASSSCLAANASGQLATATLESLVPPVKELFVIPAPPRLSSLGCGLHELAAGTTAGAWARAFERGYGEAVDKACDKVEQCVDRWERWAETGKLADGTRRMCTFRDALDGLVGTMPPREDPRNCGVAAESDGDGDGDGEDEDPDPLFDKFCRSRGLVMIDRATALDLLERHRTKLAEFVVCFVPDCGNVAGIPRLSLYGTGERVDERERREKSFDGIERAERDRVRALGGHAEGCAHLRAREMRYEEE